MEALITAAIALAFAACAVLAYRLGVADGMGAEKGVAPKFAAKQHKPTSAELERKRINDAIEKFN